MFLWKCSFIDNSCYWFVPLVKHSVAEQILLWKTHFLNIFLNHPVPKTVPLLSVPLLMIFLTKLFPSWLVVLSTPIPYPKRPIADFFVHWTALLPYSPELMLYWVVPLPSCSFEFPFLYWIIQFIDLFLAEVRFVWKSPSLNITEPFLSWIVR